MKETLLAFSAIEAVVVAPGIGQAGYAIPAIALFAYALLVSYLRPHIF